ncbi:protein of unknown function (plasmid) [Magnetospirillum sp. XM-1]|uniref:hypothetical protein n=1 Tax=unclassified Magnetospirillum TaxID=2617991 RepID=UPI00073DDABA|nr:MULTISPECIES: hypothetical protein [unclassified Magnetospirillum]ARJ66102.1 hypothetical protein WV31_10730 [Magnetospirillum sp. ME-1]CUW41909.1 protein of unknown function [Magnetospirillum sp. XM-1]
MSDMKDKATMENVLAAIELLEKGRMNAKKAATAFRAQMALVASGKEPKREGMAAIADVGLVRISGQNPVSQYVRLCRTSRGFKRNEIDACILVAETLQAAPFIELDDTL